MTTYKIRKPITILADAEILKQLPASVRKQLGETEETGFHLGAGRRDIFLTNGTVRYVLGSKTADVELDCR